ncbi:hypothetical protein WJX81_003462 [Elliptochloris bilobata]|uniref:Uncharacterized protein n=1 Tax=Elliptochloris bilobata TaxID=381761 RepID=A0AAW1RSC4_9CHLO
MLELRGASGGAMAARSACELSPASRAGIEGWAPLSPLSDASAAAAGSASLLARGAVQRIMTELEQRIVELSPGATPRSSRSTPRAEGEAAATSSGAAPGSPMNDPPAQPEADVAAMARGVRRSLEPTLLQASPSPSPAAGARLDSPASAVPPHEASLEKLRALGRASPRSPSGSGARPRPPSGLDLDRYRRSGSRPLSCNAGAYGSPSERLPSRATLAEQASGKQGVVPLAMAGSLSGRFDTSSALSRVAARAASARSGGARSPLGAASPRRAGSRRRAVTGGRALRDGRGAGERAADAGAPARAAAAKQPLLAGGSAGAKPAQLAAVQAKARTADKCATGSSRWALAVAAALTLTLLLAALLAACPAARALCGGTGWARGGRAGSQSTPRAVQTGAAADWQGGLSFQEWLSTHSPWPAQAPGTCPAGPGRWSELAALLAGTAQLLAGYSLLRLAAAQGAWRCANPNCARRGHGLCGRV